MIFCPIPIREYKVTQRFGGNQATYSSFGLVGHNGIDLARKYAWSDRSVYAPHEGYVKLYTGDTGYGNYIVIQSLPHTACGEGRQSTLAHLASFLITDGQFVYAGQKIGIMGSTGFSTGIHLHWTYRKTKNGVVQDLDNGFKGAIDVSPNVLPLLLTPLGRDS